MQCFSDQSDIAESDNVIFETSLSLTDILPINPKNYDKNRAPKVQGQPTIVYFHVTVLSLDSINEESMVYKHLLERLYGHFIWLPTFV